VLSDKLLALSIDGFDPVRGAVFEPAVARLLGKEPAPPRRVS
jgi:hypothetical protein